LGLGMAVTQMAYPASPSVPRPAAEPIPAGLLLDEPRRPVVSDVSGGR
jgi:hypothetical protein